MSQSKRVVCWLHLLKDFQDAAVVRSGYGDDKYRGPLEG